MSGTSADGIDAVLVDFAAAPPRVIAHSYLAYPRELRAAILHCSHATSIELQTLAQLDIGLGRLYAEAVQTLLQKAAISSDEVQAIGSHGQTVRHAPHGPYPFTLQLGDPNVVAEATGITTVADLRRRDVAAGGQGAPLVPAFHAALFGDRSEDRVVLNLGGMANISILPRSPGDPVRGFDTGPANVLLDAWADRNLKVPYDRNGEWAAGGAALPDLLERMLTDPYFRQAPPKSTGRERFNLGWLEGHLAGVEDARDVQTTLVELTAISLANAVEEHAGRTSVVIICGGGARNGYLMQRLAARLDGRRLYSTAEFGIDPEWIEAMAFAWLARQTLAGRPGNLPAVTGAQHPVVLGGIYLGRPRHDTKSLPT